VEQALRLSKSVLGTSLVLVVEVVEVVHGLPDLVEVLAMHPLGEM
jgi:hypothetical protein